MFSYREGPEIVNYFLRQGTMCFLTKRSDHYVFFTPLKILHLFSFKTLPLGAVMSEECAADCASSMRNGVNGTPLSVPSRTSMATLPINELKKAGIYDACPILNLHRCIQGCLLPLVTLVSLLLHFRLQ